MVQFPFGRSRVMGWRQQPVTGQASDPFLPPPTWPSPSPQVPPEVSAAIRNARGQLLSHPELLHESLAQQMFGVPTAQLTATERASLFQAVQQFQAQSANLPDDQFARMMAGNSAFGAMFSDPSTQGVWQTITQYAQQNPSQPLPTIDRQRLDTEIWQTQQQIAQAQREGDANRASQLQMQLNSLNQQKEQFNQTFGLTKEESEFQRNMQLSQLAANPRNLAQSLSMLGVNAPAYLQGTPGVRSALTQSGISAPPPGTGGGGVADQYPIGPREREPNGFPGMPGGQQPSQSGGDLRVTGNMGMPGGKNQVWHPIAAGDFGGNLPPDSRQDLPGQAGQPPTLPPLPWQAAVQQSPGGPKAYVTPTNQQFALPPIAPPLPGSPPPNPSPIGYQPQFKFIQGRQAGYMSPQGTRGMIQDYQNNTTRKGLVTGLASLGGQDENDFWNDFKQSLPKGQTAGPTRFM